jgi:phenylacetate-CoA ligase
MDQFVKEVQLAVYQRIVESLLYPVLVKTQGSKELAMLEALRRCERMSADELEAVRIERLKDILEHAGGHVPFYQRRFAEIGFDPVTVKDFSDLHRIPVLSKKDIQDYREDLISTAYKRQDLIANRTGGSTGSPLQFYHDKQRWDIRQAATIRHNLWAGHHLGQRVAVLWGHQSDLSGFKSIKAKLRNILIDRMLICDSSSFTEESLKQFATDYQRFRPETILAYANSLALVVDFMKANSIELPRPVSIITSAEVLTPENRGKIEDYFGTKVFDRYGSRETSVIASECAAHEGMHIGAEYLHLEFVDGIREVAPGATGDILITILGNHAFPFIRYQIGDVGSPAPAGICSCGVTLPKMQMVGGRTTDFLLAPDGRKVSGAALTIYFAAQVPGVKQAQIVQREVARLILNFAVNSEFGDQSRQMVEDKVRHFFGPAMAVEYRFVSAIPKEASGKYRFSICELTKEMK